MKVAEIRSKLDELKGRRDETDERLLQEKENLVKSERQLVRTEEARSIIKEVGLLTQQQLQYHISDITSSALAAVFPDPYELKTEFIERRNKSECDLLFVKGDYENKPVDSSGGGAVDVAAFALRIASWVMMTPRPRNTIILDEPFRFLSKNLQESASKMIKELSQRLQLQFIIVTHEDSLSLYADKIFWVKIKNGKSYIKNKE